MAHCKAWLTFKHKMKNLWAAAESAVFLYMSSAWYLHIAFFYFLQTAASLFLSSCFALWHFILSYLLLNWKTKHKIRLNFERKRESQNLLNIVQHERNKEKEAIYKINTGTGKLGVFCPPQSLIIWWMRYYRSFYTWKHISCIIMPSMRISAKI